MGGRGSVRAALRVAMMLGIHFASARFHTRFVTGGYRAPPSPKHPTSQPGGRGSVRAALRVAMMLGIHFASAHFHTRFVTGGCGAPPSPYKQYL